MNAIGKLTIGAVAFGLALPVAAATAMQNALPQPRTENGITYLSGGVGKAEADAMKQEAKHYPLGMVFSANKDNEYLADIRVTIKDKAGKEMLSTVSGGPIMLVKLPAGKYTVAAEAKGKTLHRTVRVRAKGERQIAFHWPHA
jgi:hypothetical protein